MNCITILSVFAAFFLTVEAITYQHKLTLKQDYSEVSWTHDEVKDVFHFKVMVKTTGWAALALTAEQGGAEMKNYDIALGGVKQATNSSNMTTYLNDYWAETETKPTLDTQQDLTRVSITEKDGWTTLEYNRKADTGDSKHDVKIEKDKPIFFAWARGDDDIKTSTDFMKHGDKASSGRGHTSVGYNLYTGKEVTSTSNTLISSAILVVTTVLLHHFA